MNIMDFVDGEILIVVPVLLGVGLILKKTPQIANWTIPWILLAISILVTFILLGISLHSLGQGVIATGIAVFAHELYKESKEKKENMKK